MDKFDTDKVWHHQYHKYYERFISPFYASRDGAILEIGIDQGKSLRMWLELFPFLHIYGIDRDLQGSGERHTIMKCDQSSETDLDSALSQISKPLFIVIDDGSHVPSHQILTFNKVFPRLEKGGVYIIEDIETSYWKNSQIYGYPVNHGYQNQESTIEIFKKNVDAVNIEFCRKDFAPTVLKHTEEIVSVTFSRNCVIIIKGEPNTRAYRFESRANGRN
jgi:hypothetical protein